MGSRYIELGDIESNPGHLVGVELHHDARHLLLLLPWLDFQLYESDSAARAMDRLLRRRKLCDVALNSPELLVYDSESRSKSDSRPHKT